MYTLLRLPLILLELALRQGAGAVKEIVRLVSGGDGAQDRSPAPTAPPEPPPAPEAELLGDEPTHVSREAETVASFGPADDPAPTIDVHAPWSGYDDQPAAEIVKRVRAADEATKAVVLLYERGHKSRSSVIRAAGGQPATA